MQKLILFEIQQLNHFLLRQQILIYFSAFLLLTFLTYAQSFSGAFLFDDFANLKSLENIRDLRTAIRYIFDGVAGPTGRPVSLLSFALQYEHWPGNAKPFIVVNTVLHLFNAILVFFLLRKIFNLVSLERADIAALIAASVWLVAPNHVSTVSYIVQRMTILSVFFGAASLVCFLSITGALGRHRLVKWLMSGLALTFFGLAVCSKENALVVALIFPLLFALMPQEQRNNNAIKLLVVIFSFLSAYVLWYVISQMFHGMFENVWIRDFSRFDRLVAQSQILVDYISKFIFPRPFTNGVFNSGHQYLQSDSSVPIGVALWLVGLCLVCACVYFVVKKRSILAFGALFFFVGHVLESTTLALELYYEHRNYLPYVGLAIIVGVSVTRVLSSNRVGLKRCLILVFSTWVAWSVFALYQRTSLWGDPLRAAYYWAEVSPDSVRAQQHAAVSFSSAGAHDKAIAYLNKAYQIDGSPFTLLNALNVACLAGFKVEGVTLPIEDFKVTPFANEAVYVFLEVVNHNKYGKCSGLGSENVALSLKNIIENDNFDVSTLKSTLISLLGVVYLQSGDFDKAMEVFDDQESNGVGSNLRGLHAVHLAVHGHCDEANKILVRAQNLEKSTKLGLLASYLGESVSEVNDICGADI